jgi:hypothetical protein
VQREAEKSKKPKPKKWKSPKRRSQN